MMYERMTDKTVEPDLTQIREYLGADSYALLCRLEDTLASQYQLSKALRFPFGNKYGWGYKYGHRSLHLCYAFLERGAFTVTLQIGDRQVPEAEKIMDSLSPKAKELWETRYPCGDTGGWIHYRVTEAAELAEVVRLINVKKAPMKGK